MTRRAPYRRIGDPELRHEIRHPFREPNTATTPHSPSASSPCGPSGSPPELGGPSRLFDPDDIGGSR